MPDNSRILVVDDSPVDMLLLSRTLTKAGYTVIQAGSGDSAVDLAVQHQPDLILLDMMMAHLDGLATCEQIKRNAATAHIPIIFVTANSETENVVRAFSAGGSDYVTKPIRTREILARVSVQLRLRQAERTLQERNHQLEFMTRQLEKSNDELARQSRIDGLTGLLNRAAWDEAAGIEEDRSNRHHHQFAILLLDVDHFKLLNDSLGHQKGDSCLQQIARAIAETCRASDVVGRYGGEEFVVLAPETAPDEAMVLAERIRERIWSLGIRHPLSPAGRVTSSIGVAAGVFGTLKELLLQADTNLYKAKSAGRNLAIGPTPDVQNGFVPGAAEVPDRYGSDSSPLLQIEPTVLVVEDNEANRAVYRGCLSKEGFRVQEAHNGEAALAAVAVGQPDVILMDLMMPVMNGIDCTRRLKTDPATRDIPVIIISACDDSNSVVAGLEAGAEEYLTKPVKNMELVARVRSMVRLGTERKDLLRSYQLRAEQIQFLTILVDFCRKIGAATDVERALDCTIEAVALITGCLRVSALLPDTEGGHLVISRSIGLAPETVQRVRVPVGEGVAGRVYRTREALMINPETHPNEQLPDAGLEPYAGTPLLMTPLGTSPRIRGVLAVTGRVINRPFEARELEYVNLITSILSSALDGIRNRQAKDHARDLVVVALARLAEHRDNNTGRHLERVTQFSCMLADTLRRSGPYAGMIDEKFVQQMHRAVALHDIGKVAIPDRILLKPGKLSLEEMNIMRTHVEIGVETLRPIVTRVPDAGFLSMALDIIRAHHEWYDGSGYPNGLKGDAIPLAARIVAVADVYDALTSDRVYKRAMPCKEAEEMIRSLSGTQFDPVIVAAFDACCERYRPMVASPAEAAERSATGEPRQPTPEAVMSAGY